MPVDPPDSDAAAVQARLLRMLDAIRLERPEPPVEQTAGPTGCAQCGSLESWGSASWCPACGYYPKLGRVVTQDEFTQASADSLSLAASLPSWLFPMLAGALFLVAESLIPLFLPSHPHLRHDWAMLQLGAGLVLLLTAHILAYARASQHSDKIQMSQLLFSPTAIWLEAIKKSPSSGRLICSGCWGILAIGMSLGVIGLDWEGIARTVAGKKTKRSNPLKAMVQTVAKTGAVTADLMRGDGEEEAEGGEQAFAGGLQGPAFGGNAGGSIESSLQGFAEAAGVDSLGGALPASGLRSSGDGNGMPSVTVAPEVKKIPPASNGEPRTEHSSYVIFGYLTNAQGELRSVLLAELNDGLPRFVGKLPLDELHASARNDLQKTLDNVRTPRPPLMTPFHARWVRPVVTCRVASLGRGTDGQIKEGYLVTYENLLAQPSAQAAGEATAQAAP